MCGICGIAGSYADDEISRMTASLAHRGPDDSSKKTFDGCGLGFARLSIIDVAGGAQPIANEDESLWIIYNGEIYNFRELRAELEALGHSFRTHTDTEVVLHGFEAWGPAVLQRLRGMFAFVIWNTREQELFLARDRLGIKPLYYTVLQGRLAFASEFKCLLTLPDLPRELDLTAIASYLGGRFALNPRTPFLGVRRLQPGHFGLWKEGKLNSYPYWQYALKPGNPGIESALASLLISTLQDTVRRMLVSEVPVGFFLSGGLDSSAILAVAAPLMENTPRTFTAVYDVGDPVISEGRFARLMADEVGSDHREVDVRAQDIPSYFAHVIWALDEPLVDPASLSEFRLSQETKARATVILVGEGSDEQFGGYAGKWKLLRLQERARRLGLARIANGISPHGPRRIGKVARAIALMKASADPQQFYFDSSSLLSAPELRGILVGEGMQDAAGAFLAERDQFFRECSSGNGVAGLDPFLIFDTRFNLPSNILLKVDRTTMASSIEARVPFLDERMLELSQQIPSSLKFDGRVEKYILRKAVAPLLPGQIAWRPKQAFRTPIGEWARELSSMAERLLTAGDGMLRDFVRPDAIRAILKTSGTGNRYSSHQFWSFLTIEIWMREYLRGESPSKIAAG
jgi:asparagine synthase (glutamine-hydrolysing)